MSKTWRRSVPRRTLDIWSIFSLNTDSFELQYHALRIFLKKLGYHLDFQLTSQCLDIWWNTPCVQYYFTRVINSYLLPNNLAPVMAFKKLYTFLSSSSQYISGGRHGNPCIRSFLLFVSRYHEFLRPDMTVVWQPLVQKIQPKNSFSYSILHIKWLLTTLLSLYWFNFNRVSTALL